MGRSESLVRWLTAAPLLAAIGCARPPTEVAQPDPSRSARAVEAAPPSVPPGEWKLVVSASREHACSLSWESVWDEVRFDLAIDDAGTARLSIESRHAVTFGSSPRIGGGGAPPTRRETSSSARHVGRARGSAEAFEVAFSTDPTSRASKDAPRGAPFVLECRSERLEIEGQGAGDAGGARTRVAALRCSVPPGLDEAIERELTLGLPLSPTPGLALRVRHAAWGAPRRELTLAERE